ncbi:MAG: peptidyl-prolyl cis-trans isomerase [Sedimentisphaerales bacterium]|nr:peptidyl-prolyl cis-trans isomerase [Sedimentisphaerales bacterium]
MIRNTGWRTALCLAVGLLGLCGCNEKKDSTPLEGKVDQTVPPVSEATTQKPAETESSPPIPAKPKAPTQVRLETSMGDILIQLNEEMAPVTTANFLRYVKEGFYENTIFHRVIPKFMIQGGGFAVGMVEKNTHPAIINESSNGLKNLRGTVAMARTPDPNSATSQFFINHVDNPGLNHGGPYGGYAVFGKVVSGMDVVDAIAQVPTRTVGMHQNVPVEPVILRSAAVIK